MEEAIDIITSYSGEPRRLRQTSSSLRESIIQNDKNIYEGILRKYNTSSIYKAAEQAIKSNDIDIISKLILQYSGQLPIPWNYLAQFVTSPQMARLVIKKLGHVNYKDQKSKLIGQFKLEDLYDQVDDKIYLCSTDESIIQQQLYRHIFYCLTPQIWQNAPDRLRIFIVWGILQYGNPQQLLDIGATIQDIMQYRVGGIISSFNIPWSIEHGIPLNRSEAHPGSREYVVENGPFEEYLKIPTGYVAEIIRNPLSRVMQSNNQISLDIASRYPDVRLYTPEQILKAIQAGLLFRDRYMDQKMLESSYDLVIDRNNAIEYIVSAFDTMNISLKRALLSVLNIKGLHADWVNYYLGYDNIQKPAGLSNIFWKQLVMEAIKQNKTTIALRVIGKSMSDITPEVATNMIKFIEKSSLNVGEQQKLINLIRSIGNLNAAR